MTFKVPDITRRDEVKATQNAVINALNEPGTVFPANVTVIFDGKEVSETVLDAAMAWVAMDRQSAKREGHTFDALASLSRAISRTLSYEADQKEAFLKKSTPAAVFLSRGGGHTWSMHRDRISTAGLKAPLLLTSEEAGHER